MKAGALILILCTSQSLAQNSAKKKTIEELCLGAKSSLTTADLTKMANDHKFPSIVEDDWTYVEDRQKRRSDCSPAMREILFPLDPRAEQALKLLQKTKEIADRDLQIQRQLAEDFIYCAKKITAPECKRHKQEFFPELQRRLTLMRLALGASQTKDRGKLNEKLPLDLSPEAPMISKLIPTFWTSAASHIQPLTSTEKNMITEPEKIKDKESRELMKLKEPRELYYMVLSRTPILAFFSKAEIEPQDIEFAYRSFLAQAEEKPSANLSRSLIEQRPYVAAAIEELTKGSQKDLGDLCFFADQLYKDHKLYQEKFPQMVAWSGLGALPFGTLVARSAAAKFVKTNLNHMPARVAPSTKAEVMGEAYAQVSAGASVSMAASAYEHTLSGLRTDRLCRQVHRDKVVSEVGLCNLQQTTESLEQAQSDAMFSAIFAGTTSGVPWVYRVIRPKK